MLRESILCDWKLELITYFAIVVVRMESLSKPGHIHVSQATADELTAKGRGSWLTMREDKVVAKGKGEMQTFWAVPSSIDKSTSGSDWGLESSHTTRQARREEGDNGEKDGVQDATEFNDEAVQDVPL